jgi:hypothetical protein
MSGYQTHGPPSKTLEFGRLLRTVYFYIFLKKLNFILFILLQINLYTSHCYNFQTIFKACSIVCYGYFLKDFYLKIY